MIFCQKTCDLNHSCLFTNILYYKVFETDRQTDRQTLRK